MKQHITRKQLDELSCKEAGILADRLNLEITPDKDYIELPSIGQMIEFIGDGWWKLCWGLKCNEVCDTLWRAVKYKLKEIIN